MSRTHILALLYLGCASAPWSDEPELVAALEARCDEGDVHACAQLGAHLRAADRADESARALVRACRLGAEPALRRDDAGDSRPVDVSDTICMNIIEPSLRPATFAPIEPPPFGDDEVAAIERRVCLDHPLPPAPTGARLCACDRLGARARASGDEALGRAAAEAFPGATRPGCVR